MLGKESLWAAAAMIAAVAAFIPGLKFFFGLFLLGPQYPIQTTEEASLEWQIKAAFF